MRPSRRLAGAGPIVTVALLAVAVVGATVLGWQHYTDRVASATQALGDPTSPTATGSTPAPGRDKSHPRTPDVPIVVEADFAAGRIPADFATFDDGTSHPMTVSGGRLVHGSPTGSTGASYLEAALPDDVQRIGAEVRFADTAQPGGIALIAWEDSLVAKRTDEKTLPRSGLHFVAFPGSWHLGTIDPSAPALETIVGSGSYSGASGSQVFEVVRRGGTVWVTDPSGGVTKVQDPRIAEYAGPWADWELFDPARGSAPASFARVWAG